MGAREGEGEGEGEGEEEEDDAELWKCDETKEGIALISGGGLYNPGGG